MRKIPLSLTKEEEKELKEYFKEDEEKEKEDKHSIIRKLLYYLISFIKGP